MLEHEFLSVLCRDVEIFGLVKLYTNDTTAQLMNVTPKIEVVVLCRASFPSGGVGKLCKDFSS